VGVFQFRAEIPSAVARNIPWALAHFFDSIMKQIVKIKFMIAFRASVAQVEPSETRERH